MNENEYKEKIQELQLMNNYAKKAVELLQASNYLSEQMVRAYREAFDTLILNADTIESSNVLEQLNKKLNYINMQYKEHMSDNIL